MAFVHNVEIVWDELLDAFTSLQKDQVHFLDRQTGEIFAVPAALDDEEFWHQMDNNKERFLEIPRMDYGIERQFISGFIGAIEDRGLKQLLDGSLNGAKPYGKLNDIISFFPEESERLQEMKDEFVTSRVKHWLEVNNLYMLDSDMIHTRG